MFRKRQAVFIVIYAFSIFSCTLFNACAKDVNEIHGFIGKVDKLISRGDVVFYRKNNNRYFTESISYWNNQNFISKTLKYSNGKYTGKLIQPPITQIYDGHSRYMIIDKLKPSDTKSIAIGANIPDDLSESFKISGGPYPGASYILGRGLFTLTEASIVSGGGGVVVLKGKSIENNYITAILDPKHDYVAKRIDRSYKGRLIQRILLGKPVFKTGQWVASSAICQKTAGSHFTNYDEYSLVSASFTPPKNRITDINLDKGSIVSDERLGKMVVWKMAVNLKAADLLDRTKVKLTELESARSKVESAERSSRYLQALLFLSPALLLTGLVFWKRRSTKRIANSERLQK